MKAIKSILITLIALLLTGCYTQLQYSQKMNKVTDRNKKEVTENYQDGEERATNEAEAETGEEYAEYDGEENAVPVYYKDYEYVERYNDCNCSPYNVYNFYGSPYDWYGYNHYRPYYSFRSHLSLSSYYFHKWHHRRYFGYPRFAFSFSWGWGSPHSYHSFYHDPFYYGHGYSPFAYNYQRYYGSFGYGYYYGGNKQRVERDDDTRYGPRSIGTNRVVDGDRTRSVSNETGRSATVTNSRSTVKTRSSSVGSTRTRGTTNSNSGSVNRTRSRSGGNSSSGTTRSRSGDNLQTDNSRERVYIDRTDESKPVVIDRDRYNAIIRSRTIASQNSLTRSDNNNRNTLRKVRSVNINSNSKKKERSTFFQRMKGFFENNTGRIITNSTRSSSSTIRSRSSSSSNRSSVSRSKSSSSSRSSVSRSSSSSSNSRSRGGSSSSSRSRSGGDSGSSSSDRSRGN